ncbi:MAG: wax ester/triacylglycerol synthase family O-acyltransferase [Acidobacteriota bacterium]|nr:wax ester/triacylglycerol synthase family O-acyltransferase [Acidobacteriota bacterium]
MRQLSGLDAGFLSLETSTAPMLIGSVSILDPRTTDGRLGLDRFREVLKQRLAHAVALRRRLASLPLDLTRPYWVELEPEKVDLEAHVERTRLPEPGGWHELSELMAFEMSRRLDRDRPLWQILFVEGVDSVPGAPQGSIALIGRVHHAAVDGVSGAEILGALFDGTPVVQDVPAGGQRPRREPRALDLLVRAGRDLASAPLEVSGVVGRSLLGLAGGALARLRQDDTAPLPFTAPRTRINRPIVAERSWAPALFDLARLKAIKSSEGTTVNDVVLAVCAGALRSWLAERDELPEEPLVAMVPVSVRTDSERRQAGNLVSAMLVSLATDKSDPLERLRAIRDATRSSKVAHQAVGARTLVGSAELVPFALSGLGVRLYSRLHLADRHRPLFNLVITNVPGPARPLTIAGARMLTHVASAPVFDGLGLILPVFSYAGTLSIGVTADRTILPDAGGLAAKLTTGLEDLERSLAG